MSTPPPLPPAIWIFEFALPGGNRDAILGDLIEEYGIRLRSEAASAARMWYWAQVLRTLPRLALFRNGKAHHAAAITVAVFIFAGAAEAAAVAGLTAVVSLGAEGHFIATLIIGLATMVIGGFLAALFHPAAVILFAAAQIIATVTLIITRSESAPFWFQMSFLILAPLASLAGGLACLRIKFRRSRSAK